MKLISLFDDFLSDTVNLNRDRFNKLEDSIEALKRFIENSNWEPEIVEFSAQGSWAHKTIIKPLPDCPFDADLLVYVEPVEGWEPKDYINKLHGVFSASELYKDKLRRFSHCVTIEYAGERKIDIAPCIKERIYANCYEVCNRTSNEFEESSPKEYTDWLHERNRLSTKNNLKKVTRLLKYMRDIKTNFTCPSFLLTTLIGMQVRDEDLLNETLSDVPTALKVLIGRLDDWLQSNVTKPTVRNPVLFTEEQSGAWDDVKYDNFRSKINKYRVWIDEAYDESDRASSISAWRLVFGDDFAKSEVVEKASTIGRAACESLAVAGEMFKDLVDRVKALGRSALPIGFSNLPHMHKPQWRLSKSQISVQIRAYLRTTPDSPRLKEVASLSALSTGGWLEFCAFSGSGLPLPNDYKIMWRVTNTDEVAKRNNALRGDFYKSDTHAVRKEHLSYRGVHMVEAFLVRKSDDTLAGVSEVFYVAID